MRIKKAFCFVLAFIMTMILAVPVLTDDVIDVEQNGFLVAEDSLEEIIFADSYIQADSHVQLEIDLSGVELEYNRVYIIYFYASDEWGRSVSQPGVAFSIRPVNSSTFEFVYRNLTSNVIFSISTVYTVRQIGISINPSPRTVSETLFPNETLTVPRFYMVWTQVSATVSGAGNDGRLLIPFFTTVTNPITSS